MSKTSTSTLQLAPVYRETFDRLFSGEKDNTWLPMRRSAMQSFESIGLPGPRTEAWRYTNLAKVSAMPFVPAPSTEQLQALNWKNWKRYGSTASGWFSRTVVTANRSAVYSPCLPALS